MIIIKIGGGKEINLKGAIKDLSNLDEKFIIILGANALRDNIMKEMNREKKVVTSVKGYSSVFSDENLIDMQMMVYSGLKSKRVVELCQQNGINALGLSGLDGQLVKGKRNLGIKVRENEKLKILRDFSGKPKEINTSLLNLLLDNGYIPVITVPILDENNFAINSENDDILNLLQNSLKANKIISLIEAPGFLDDKDDETSLVKEMKKEELEKREAQVQGRMKRKMLALKKLFLENETTVYISDGRTQNPIKDALNGSGTIIK